MTFASLEINLGSGFRLNSLSILKKLPSSGSNLFYIFPILSYTMYFSNSLESPTWSNVTFQLKQSSNPLPAKDGKPL